MTLATIIGSFIRGREQFSMAMDAVDSSVPELLGMTAKLRKKIGEAEVSGADCRKYLHGAAACLQELEGLCREAETLIESGRDIEILSPETAKERLQSVRRHRANLNEEFKRVMMLLPAGGSA